MQPPERLRGGKTHFGNVVMLGFFEGGPRAPAAQIHQAGNYGEPNLYIFVLQHGFQQREERFGGGRQAQRDDGLFTRIRIFLLQGLVEHLTALLGLGGGARSGGTNRDREDQKQGSRGVHAPHFTTGPPLRRKTLPLCRGFDRGLRRGSVLGSLGTDDVDAAFEVSAVIDHDAGGADISDQAALFTNGDFFSYFHIALHGTEDRDIARLDIGAYLTVLADREGVAE